MLLLAFLFLPHLALLLAHSDFVRDYSRGDGRSSNIDQVVLDDLALSASEQCFYWLEDINHSGVAPFASSGYQVFRNVKNPPYNAKGDGHTDDTDAINRAISDGSRCEPFGICPSSTTTPALIYLPPGIYNITSPIILYYYTQLIGNPNCIPVLQATPGFAGAYIIDADPYIPGAPGPPPNFPGVQSYNNTNVFWRQVRNLVLDTTKVSPSTGIAGIHWPTAQATSLQNLVFRMSDASGTTHVGLDIENGSGGFITDLVFYGGKIGASLGNQQFTMSNLTFHGAVTAIKQIWDWGWTYQGLSFNNCTTGVDIADIGASAQQIGTVILFDTAFQDVQTAILTSYTSVDAISTEGSLILENVELTRVLVAVQGPTSVLLAGTSSTSQVAAWGQGHSYNPSLSDFQGSIAPVSRPPALITSTGAYYKMSKPQYEDLDQSEFVSVRSSGAKGDGNADDTIALQNAITSAASSGKVLFVDAGYYKVTNTVYVPSNSKLVGEAYPVILASGPYFGDIENPRPVVKIGDANEKGQVELSDFIVSTQGPTAGAVLFEWNLQSDPGVPSGMWDVHARIGGFKGSQLQLADCPPDPATPRPPVNNACIAASMSMNVTRFAGGLYMENVWLWVADHDLDDIGQRQISVYAGRGIHIDNTAGPIWMYGTASEHHALYQYQVSSSTDIIMGQIQTETAYYQPNPPANIPFTPRADFGDPTFPAGCIGSPGMTNTCSGLGLRIVDSQNVSVYGAGLYSFFNNYNQACLATADCQASVLALDGSQNRDLNFYSLNTIGSQSMVTRNGANMASLSNNLNWQQAMGTISLFRV